ncbi:MAG: hypothetical protein CL731_09870, partial [Chloroflexi bacterium]|nr:hypothetical protein [Chloroflexota bacterium]
MKLGMVGLGRMGGNMTERLLKDGHDVVVYDPDSSAVAEVSSKGATAATSLSDILDQLEAPRTVWVMVPAGDITEQTVNDLVGLLDEGDTLIDGGNSNYKESQRRALHAAASGVDKIGAFLHAAEHGRIHHRAGRIIQGCMHGDD